ncbi:MAG: DUF5060 domain-containing protein [Opitutus sp.]
MRTFVSSSIDRAMTVVTMMVLLATCSAHVRAADAAPTAASIHAWDKHELTFTATGTYKNPYTEVIVWVDLEGPGFSKRVYGFWDGGQVFQVRVLATEPGTWRWKSGSMPEDAGLSGKTGTFEAIAWTDAEKEANPVRRGMIRATANGHALEFPDGTPYFAIGDTWFSLGANRFKWKDDDQPREIGPEAGFQDYVRYRKAQGYNWIAVIAAFPNWSTDGRPFRLTMTDADKTPVRFAWLEFGTGSAKNMDNEGGKPFFFPGKVPGFEDVFADVDRLNPEYFKYLDRKIDFLNANGFVPFIEVSRRDASPCWKRFHGWPDSYARFMQYIFARYQANNTVLAPVHLDILQQTVSAAEFSDAVRVVQEKFGLPPFGTLLSSNSNPSSLTNWGADSWVTLHQTGNKREHNYYWYLTEIYNLAKPRPALNGEPYYAGYKDVRGLGGEGYRFGAEGGTERDDLFCRSGMYGSFLSGGFAGHTYGAEGIWGADIEPNSPVKMWDAFRWRSGAQMQHLRTFALSIGKRYQELVPLADLVSPNKDRQLRAYEGWAYCARTPDKNIFLLYFEKGAPMAEVRGARPNGVYRAEWFDPRTGTWSNVDSGTLTSDLVGVINLPHFPTWKAFSVVQPDWLSWAPQKVQDRLFRAAYISADDWGLRLVYQGEGPIKRTW